MKQEVTDKVIRCFAAAVIFLAMISLQGMNDDRQANQIVFMLAVISLFSLILKNIWITLFVLWTVFLYSFFKFSSGAVYLSNVFFGCIFYYIVKSSFKRNHIGFFINAFLWFVFVNIAYMAVQASGYDFIFSKIVTTAGFQNQIENSKPNGFMGHASILGTLIALAIPMLMTRNSKLAMIGALGLFVPLYISKTSLCFLMGIIGFLFVLYYKIPKRLWVMTTCIVFILGLAYIQYIDKPGVSRIPQWHRVLRDSMIHPVTGWGLDSFRNITPQKDFRYSDSVTSGLWHETSDGKIYNNITVINWWDNPHNLYISLLFEWGIFGLILFIGYIRQNIMRFKHSTKYPDVVGLAGFILVFLGISLGHFPAFLARMMCFVIPVFALFEVITE